MAGGENAVTRVSVLLKLPMNAVCADCGAKKSQWASINLGVFVCIDCSGIHRSLGTHISFIRSCTLDAWTTQQADFMESRGNEFVNSVYEKNIPDDFARPCSSDKNALSRFIRDKYVNKKWFSQQPSVVIEPVIQAEKRKLPSRSLSEPQMSSIRRKKRRSQKESVSEVTEINTRQSTSDEDSSDSALTAKKKHVEVLRQVETSLRKPGTGISKRMQLKLQQRDPLKVSI